jgi:hypothetical protein
VNTHAFQFSTSDGHIIADVSGLTIKEAHRMWGEHVYEYKDLLRKGREPKMIIWCAMHHDTDYRFKSKHWMHENMHLIGDRLYMIVA